MCNLIIIKWIVPALKSDWMSHIEPLNNKQYKHTHQWPNINWIYINAPIVNQFILLFHKAALQETILTHILAILGWSKSEKVFWSVICGTFLAAPVLLQASLSSGLNLTDRAARACVYCRLYSTFTTHVKCSAHKHTAWLSYDIMVNTRWTVVACVYIVV